MDPTMPTRPKHWRKYKGFSVTLLIAAVVMAASGWVGSNLGLDPGVAYRLAALLAAGAFFLGIVWAASAGMRDGTGDQDE